MSSQLGAEKASEMSYRSKRTYAKVAGDAPKDKEPISASNSSLATSQPPPKKPFDPSTDKWGPFNPPTLKAKNITKFTLTPTNKASQSTTTREILNQQQYSNTAASKKKVTHSRLEASQHQGNFDASQVPSQRNSGVLQGQQRTTSFPSQHKEVEVAQKEMQPSQKRARQPAITPSIGIKPPTEKEIGVATNMSCHEFHPLD